MPSPLQVLNQRRGILDADEAKRHSKDVSNIAPGFRISGLGQLIEAGIQADRLVVFGDEEGAMAKKFLYINRKAPYGTIYALESLEVVLIGAAFEQDVSLAFIDDGVYQLMAGQDTTGAWMNNFSRTYKALGDFEVRKLYVERESLKERGLTLDDLQQITWEDENDYVELDESAAPKSAGSIASQDVVLSF